MKYLPMTKHPMCEHVIRAESLRPYLPTMGPTFRVFVWDTDRTDEYGKSILGYRLEMRAPLNSAKPRIPVVLFEGEDFSCSPLNGIDSDEMLAALFGFLTLKPGDTDPEYFESYTKEQLDYCSEHAESLAAAAIERFGED